MSAVATRPPEVRLPEAVARTPRKRWTRFILPTYVTAFILYLSFPIFIIILFSFNQTRGGFGTSPGSRPPGSGSRRSGTGASSTSPISPPPSSTRW